VRYDLVNELNTLEIRRFCWRKKKDRIPRIVGNEFW